jgi:hypothetical protein
MTKATPPKNAGKHKVAVSNVMAALVVKSIFDDILPSEEHILEEGVYADHIADINDALQSELAKTDIGMSVRLVTASAVNERIRELMRRGEFDEDSSGRAWRNQAETLAVAIVKMLQNPKRSMVIIGSTQLGKTMTIILMSVLEMLLFLKTGSMYKAIYLTPRLISVTNQTKEDIASFYALYDFEVERDGKTGLYSEYRTRLRNRVSQDNPEAFDSPVVCRNNPSVNELKVLMAKLHAKNMRVIFIVDECHWGSQKKYIDEQGEERGTDGVMKQMLSFAKQLTNNAEGDLLIAISATPFNLNCDNLTTVFCRTFLGYVGYAFWKGHHLDPRYPLILPEVYGFGGDFIKSLGVKEMQYVNRNYYRNLNGSYEKAQVKEVGRGQNRHYTDFAMRWMDTDHEDYKKWCEEKLIGLVKACLLQHNDKAAKGFILRFFQDNMALNDFANKWRGKLRKDNIYLVEWKEEGASQSLHNYIAELDIPDDAFKLVLVSGHGRMGIRIKDSLRIYFGADFSETSTLASLLQGLLGRMTGKKSKPPTMFVNDGINKSLAEYVRTLGRSIPLKPHERMLETGYHVYTKELYLWCETPGKGGGLRLDGLGMGDYEDYLQSWTKRRLGGKSPASHAAWLRHHPIPDDEVQEFWKQTNDLMGRLEQVLELPHQSLVRYTKQKDANKEPFVDEQGYAYDGNVGFRAGDSSRENSTLPSTRSQSSNKKGHRILQPQVTVERKGRGWRAVMIKLRFGRKTHVGEPRYLPKPSDVGHEFLTEDEKEAVR